MVGGDKDSLHVMEDINDKTISQPNSKRTSNHIQTSKDVMNGGITSHRTTQELALGTKE
jgi:hypothetical protein